MEWVIAGLIVVAALFLLPWMIATRSDPARRGGGIAGDFMVGAAEQFDPRAAMVVHENEKRDAMEGEQESGDPKDTPESAPKDRSKHGTDDRPSIDAP